MTEKSCGNCGNVEGCQVATCCAGNYLLWKPKDAPHIQVLDATGEPTEAVVEVVATEC